jgi:transcriptional regulator with XRE-family HTH domain
MDMAHIDKLKAIFDEKGFTYTEIGKRLGLASSTVKKKFESDNVNTIVNFLDALGIQLIDEKGIDIVTGKKYISKKSEHATVQIGNTLFTLEDLDKLKEMLDNL